MFYTVYKITNTINGKIYIGVHKTDNLDDDYMGSGVHLKRAQTKYGLSAFKKEYIRIFDNPEDMFDMESTLVNEDFVKAENTYNLKLGGSGGFDHINGDPDLQVKSAKRGHLAQATAFENTFDKTWGEVMNACGLAGLEKKYGPDWGNFCSQRATKAMIEKYPHSAFFGKTHTTEAKAKIGKANAQHQKGSGNSQFGTCWVHSLIEQKNKKINKDELETYISNGWIQGRKMKF